MAEVYFDNKHFAKFVFNDAFRRARQNGRTDYQLGPEHYCRCKEDNTMITMEALNDTRVIIDGYMYRPTRVSHRSYKNDVSLEVTLDPQHRVGMSRSSNMRIKNVIFNHPATIVFWNDNTKTVVKCQKGDEFDPEKGLTMAFVKKVYGNKGSYFDEVKKWTTNYEAPKPAPIDFVAIANAVKELGVDPESITLLKGVLKEGNKESEDKAYSFHDVYFTTRNDAEKALDTLREVIVHYGFATVMDLYDLVGDPSSYNDSKHGWTDLKNVRIMRIGGDYVLALPEAVEIE